MSMMTLSQAQTLVTGLDPTSRMVGDGAIPLERVHTDTRTLREGDLFVALRGETFDGHDCIDRALAAGARAVVASRGRFVSGLMVGDTLLALQALAQAWRQRFALPLIAVTGSNGKTTVTQMIASILRAWVGSGALATEGNFNNHIGVPLTLLRLRQGDDCYHRAAVVELGMNHVGEIARLAALAQPTVALVNNAQREHQEFMHSVQAVAEENGSVITALTPAGVAVFPAGDTHTVLWQTLAASRRVLTFGLAGTAHGGAAGVPAADVRAAGVWAADRWALTLSTPHGRIDTTVAAPGEHSLCNAAAAAACALAAGAPNDAVAQGLADFQPVKGRLVRHAIALHGAAATLIDDSYNANPDSVRAAIDVLAALPAPRWLLLGDMGEVGAHGPAFHREVGAYARERGIEHLWTAGALAEHAHASFGNALQSLHQASTQALDSALGVANSRAPRAASVLVKGSRFMAMERLVDTLKGGRDAR
jgi:UDP-N-acetylmuramoyl-tripeptide--D-alanyl-D-alanine ligase